MSLQVAFANAMLDKLLNDENFDIPEVWLSLHTAEPGVNDTEVVGGGYERRPFVGGFAINGEVSNAEYIQFAAMPPVRVTHAALWDAPERGSMLWVIPLGEPKAIGRNDIAHFDAGSLRVSLVVGDVASV